MTSNNGGGKNKINYFILFLPQISIFNSNNNMTCGLSLSTHVRFN